MSDGNDVDNDDGYFDYNSSQNYYDIEYQVNLLEMQQSIKRDRYWKKKRNRSLNPISTRKLQTCALLLKINSHQCEEKSVDCQHVAPVAKDFECDEKFLMKPINPKFRNLVSKERRKFSGFRRRFYEKHHKTIKESLKDRSELEIVNIRLAPITQTVQSQFMKRVHENRSCVSQLVYHGTQLKNMQGILRYGFLVPNQPHPTIKHAPIIQSLNGQAYGQGIYCSRRASYSTYYSGNTNTILVCAAVPNYNQNGKVQYHGNILVLSHVSQIIPLFLMDFNYINRQNCNCRRCHPDRQLPTDNSQIDIQSAFVGKGVLRKILKYINDSTRRHERYQIRLPDHFK